MVLLIAFVLSTRPVRALSPYESITAFGLVIFSLLFMLLTNRLA